MAVVGVFLARCLRRPSRGSLIAYLTKPSDFIPKTRMSFPGLRNEADIDNLIAYLAQFSK